ncbi:PPE domain-containing protein [Mycobacterium seoulense]|uniref:PPE domain-containing protein n=1 Tax=Mycobacterium seoulense TaxID=386911 RepID=UPI003CEDD783
MTQTLKVEYEELMARAAELEEPLPVPPQGNPQAPSALSISLGAAKQLAMSADTIREYLAYCEREYQRLAKSLRNAAKAYEEVDEGAAEAISNSMSESAATRPAGGNDLMAVNCDPNEDWGYDPLPPPPPPPPPFEYPYYEVRQAAYDIEAPDQGAAFLEFSRQWEKFQLELQQKTLDRFRPFKSWESDNQILVEQNFQEHRNYIFAMVQSCLQVSNQAKAVHDAHKKARWEHPTPYDIESCDSWYKKYMTEGDPHGYLYMIMTWYQDLQKKSEEVLGNYVREANLPLQPVIPRNPPKATRIDAPSAPGEGDGTIPGGPYDGLPGDEGGLGTPPTLPTMPPGMGGAPDKAAMDAAMKDALKGKPGMPAGAGMKPASLGGGGGGGVPGMPLQPAVDSEAASRPAGAAPGAAGPGRAMPGAAAAAGGGMGGGMAPMGGAGQGQNQGKGKRVQSDDDSLYTEERPWTEGVIGNRPRKAAAPDK